LAEVASQKLSDSDVLRGFELAFGGLTRPAHFTNYTHCSECREHDELLCARDNTTLAIEDVGSQAWNPITMATPEGFAYFLPALARLALDPVPDKQDWYGYIILFELRWNGPRNDRWLYCTLEQRKAVAALLEHLYETRTQSIELYHCAYELMEALEIWSDAGGDDVAVGTAADG
jgi:hypothetical protein